MVVGMATSTEEVVITLGEFENIVWTSHNDCMHGFPRIKSTGRSEKWAKEMLLIDGEWQMMVSTSWISVLILVHESIGLCADIKLKFLRLHAVDTRIRRVVCIPGLSLKIAWASSTSRWKLVIRRLKSESWLHKSSPRALIRRVMSSGLRRTLSTLNWTLGWYGSREIEEKRCFRAGALKDLDTRVQDKRVLETRGGIRKAWYSPSIKRHSMNASTSSWGNWGMLDRARLNYELWAGSTMRELWALKETEDPGNLHFNNFMKINAPTSSIEQILCEWISNGRPQNQFVDPGERSTTSHPNKVDSWPALLSEVLTRTGHRFTKGNAFNWWQPTILHQFLTQPGSITKDLIESIPFTRLIITGLSSIAACEMAGFCE